MVLALLYLLFADGMLQGQSPGKKLFGVRVVYLPTRQPARHRDSVLRNAPLGLVIILSMMPELGLKALRRRRAGDRRHRGVAASCATPTGCASATSGRRRR